LDCLVMNGPARCRRQEMRDLRRNSSLSYMLLSSWDGRRSKRGVSTSDDKSISRDLAVSEDLVRWE
jgi:hypothetical protein